MAKNSKLWAGRLSESTSQILDEFNQSLSFDRNLLEEDIEGSQAHVSMLAKQKIISQDEAASITKALEEIKSEYKSKTNTIKDFEDIHSFVEAKLISLIGDTGKKLHTARSRNDQVITDLKLWLKKQIKIHQSLLQQLRTTLVERAEKDIDHILPGYTHMQQAQAISLGHYWLAQEAKLARDSERLQNCLDRVDINPLGSGALAGTSFEIDREFTTQELGFASCTTNSLDAVSDRDYVCEFEFVLSMIMIHLSQLAEEMIIWNTQEFGFIEIADTHATGSSMMPQKKNPDIPELIRGKTGRVIGVLNALMITLKALPLAYNKDLQEDKEMLFMANNTVQKSLAITISFLENITANKERMYQAVLNSYCSATDVADYLARKGMAFRDAYALTGSIIQDCIQRGKYPYQLSLEEWQKFNANFAKDILNVIKPENSVDARNVIGGTARTRVKEAIKVAKGKINAEA